MAATMSAPMKAKRVAVIGAGAAGLAAARRLLEQGIACTLFDTAAQVGGGWAEKTSAIWPTLRTNLPAMIMQFHDFSFSEACLGAQADDGPVSAKPESPAPESAAAPAAATSAPARAAAAAGRLPPTAASPAHPPESGTMATPSFVSPRAVASYLYEFHRRFLVPFIADGNVTTSPDNLTGVGRVPGATLEMRLLCDVVSVKHAAGVDGTQWRVAWQRVTTSAAHATSDAVGPSGAEVADDFAVFDAVVVANGHYNTPFSPQYTGQAAWPGTAIHSSAFRSPDVWSGQRVVVVGAKSSGTDIARELVAAGCEVHVADKECAQSVEHADPHIHHHPPIRLLAPSGAVVFDDGVETAAVSLIINCTGYDYTFSFLENETVSVADRGVRPLYKHLFSIADPSLIFIGLPWVIIPFPLFDAQAQLAARVLAGTASLPSSAEQAQDLREWMGGLPRARDAHKLAAHQFDYCRELARLGGFFTDALDRRLRVVEHVYRHVGASRPTVVGGADDYRDVRYEFHTESAYRVQAPGNAVPTIHHVESGAAS